MMRRIKDIECDKCGHEFSTTEHTQCPKCKERLMDDYKIRPRSEVEELVTKFIVDNKIHAQYGKDTEGIFIVQFLVEEEIDEE